MAEASLVADSRDALWTDRVEVSLVKREIGPTEVAGVTLALAWSTASRTPNYRGIVGLWVVNTQSDAT